MFATGAVGPVAARFLHFQLMDHPRVVFADGIPFSFGFSSGDAETDGVPGTQQPFLA